MLITCFESMCLPENISTYLMGFCLDIYLYRNCCLYRSDVTTSYYINQKYDTASFVILLFYNNAPQCNLSAMGGFMAQGNKQNNGNQNKVSASDIFRITKAKCHKEKKRGMKQCYRECDVKITSRI